MLSSNKVSNASAKSPTVDKKEKIGHRPALPVLQGLEARPFPEFATDRTRKALEVNPHVSGVAPFQGTVRRSHFVCSGPFLLLGRHLNEKTTFSSPFYSPTSKQSCVYAYWKCRTKVINKSEGVLQLWQRTLPLALSLLWLSSSRAPFLCAECRLRGSKCLRYCLLTN